MKIFASLIFLIFYSSIQANAGDFAKRHIHGFSVDGGLFAFEEYGRQDGSGFPYSNLYVIDTQNDQWTAGSPFRTLLKDETKSVFDAREESSILAGPVMKSFEDRGTIVATNQPTEIGFDKKRILAYPRMVVPPIDDSIEFRLEIFSLNASETCESFGSSAAFKLLQIGTRDGQATRLLHEDKNIPASRNCPLNYDFADLVTYYPENKAPLAAIIILMQSVGFEGPNGRYLTITTQLGK
ncbi:MAG: DUF2259 domain-containing protein [Pseudomonadota bacterium]